MFDFWRGDNYSSTVGPRTLVLGESHYGKHEPHFPYKLREKTKVYVKDQMGDEPHPFYTKVAHMLIGHKPDLEEKKIFWNSVAYHVLITEPLLSARLAPTFEQWQASLIKLPEVIAELKPDYVVALGYRMWDQLDQLTGIVDRPELTGVGPRGIRSFGDAYWHGTMHPSAPRFSPLEWHGHIEAAKGKLWPK